MIYPDIWEYFYIKALANNTVLLTAIHFFIMYIYAFMILRQVNFYLNR